MATFLKCVVAVLLYCVVNASHVRADDTEVITLEELARRLTAWRGSFVNLHAVWELRSLPETQDEIVDWPPAPDASAGSLFCRDEWIWADHGLDLLESKCFFFEDGSSKVRSIDAFNGPKGVVFRAQFRKQPDTPEEYTNLLLTGLGVGKSISRMARAPTEGLYWPAYAAWLPEKLSEWTWKLEAIEAIDGEPCARIVAASPEVSDVPFLHILWLDLNHDCLVRRYRTPPIAKRRQGEDRIIDEFQRLESGIWFPKRGRLQLGGTPHQNQMFVVTEVAVNESIDLARFDPPVPAVGTTVNDHGRTYRHGVSPAQTRNGDATGATPKAIAASSSKSPQLSGAPAKPGWIGTSAALIGMSIVFLFVGIWYSRKK